jgi:phosphorylcholine metabolism protein LicD
MNNIEVSNLSTNQWKKIRHKYVNKSEYDFSARTKNLLDIKEVLDTMGITFWLTNGTILAAYREHDWIKWDDDVDLDVYEEDLKPNYNILRNKFLESGFIVRGTNVRHGCKMALFRDKEKTALRGLYLDPKFKDNKYRLRKRYKYPRKFYEKFGTIKFMGSTFRCPSPVEEFLVYVYGKNWRIPMNSDDESVYSTKDIKR